MNRREFVAGLIALPALARPASAEVSSIKLGKQYGLPFLPQMVMEDHKLIELHAAKLGVNGLQVGWQTMGGPGALNDGLLSGQIQFVNVAAPSLATLWDKTLGSPMEVRAICAVQSMPYILTTRNPKVKTIADFTDADRIAVPTVKISGQAMALQMAAAKLWGQDHYDKLDAFTVTMGHPDAMQSILTGQTVNSHFTVAPFNYYELRHPGNPRRAQELRYGRRQAHQRHPGHHQGVPRRQPEDLRGGARLARGSQRLHQGAPA